MSCGVKGCTRSDQHQHAQIQMLTTEELIQQREELLAEKAIIEANRELWEVQDDLDRVNFLLGPYA